MYDLRLCLAAPGGINQRIVHPNTGKVLYDLYLERITVLRANPPDTDWDGSFTFTKK